MPEGWFTRFPARFVARARVFAFPYAGGGANVYRSWSGGLDHAELLAACLPGRERRTGEPLVDDLDTLVAHLTAAVSAEAEHPFLLFGHSLGALLAYETALRLESLGYRPAHLLVAGFRAPSQRRLAPALHRLDDQTFVKMLRRYGGAPAAFFEHEELVSLFLPMLRADFKLDETYSPVHSNVLRCPITAIAASNDNIVQVEEMVSWEQETSGTFALHLLDGSHFFLESHAGTVLRVLNGEVERLLASERQGGGTRQGGAKEQSEEVD